MTQHLELACRTRRVRGAMDPGFSHLVDRGKLLACDNFVHRSFGAEGLCERLTQFRISAVGQLRAGKHLTILIDVGASNTRLASTVGNLKLLAELLRDVFSGDVLRVDLPDVQLEIAGARGNFQGG